MPETQKAFVENCSPDKKSYSSPKHCVPPTYPSRELVQQEQIYPSPADQLEEITLKEQRADITALPAPTAPPPLSPPSDSHSRNNSRSCFHHCQRTVRVILTVTVGIKQRLSEVASGQECSQESECGLHRCKKAWKSRPWTLPPCQVTVQQRQPGQFWEQVKQKALECGEWELVEKLGMPNAGGSASASASAEGDAQVYPVFKASPGSNQQDSHSVIAWKVVQNLQMRVAKYGLRSPEVMQIIRVINIDLILSILLKCYFSLCSLGVLRVIGDRWQRELHWKIRIGHKMTLDVQLALMP